MQQRKKNNTTLVREYIRSLIIDRGLKAGDMLPCEGEIADALEISKSSVREATHALESIGLIEIRHGIGLVIRDFNLDAVSDMIDYSFLLDPHMIVELYDLRRQLETSLMPRVIERMDMAHIERCQNILNEWGQLVEKNRETYDVDHRFHETLYSVVDNRILMTLCHIFWSTYQKLERNEKIFRETPQNLQTARETLEDHKNILVAVQDKDSKRASELMFKHFRKFQDESRSSSGNRREELDRYS